jgi:hypothetical protein
MELIRRRNSRKIAGQFGLVACLLLTGCFEVKHPDRSRYEYLYIDGIFQPPYNSFPAGIERSNWRCFDAKVEREFDCTMVRGGWENFKYIYRQRG